MATLTLKNRRGWWHAYGSIGGRRVRQGLGTRDKKQARELAAALEARLFKEKAYGSEAVRTFAEAFVAYAEAGGETVYAEPLVRHFGKMALAQITPGDVTAAARRLYPAHSGATRNRHVVTPVRAVINHAAELGWCPPIRIKQFKVEKPKRRAIGRDWIDLFMAQADMDGLPHLSALVLFMFQTGTRISEACRVTWDNVDFGTREVALERTKTGRWEVAYLTPELVERLGALPRTGRVFRYTNRDSARCRMIKVCARAGIEYLTPHQAGRHSFATNAFAMGASLPVVMKAGRWKSSRLVLETYAHADDAGEIITGLFEGQTDPQKPDTNLTRANDQEPEDD
jgi:integrase